MYEFEAIGTHWWFERLDGVGFSSNMKNAIQQYTAEFDRRYSRFRDDSLVAKLSRDGVLYHPPLEMLEMLQYAQTMFGATEGVFSPFVGNDLENLGYGSSRNKKTAFNIHHSKNPKRLSLFSEGVDWDKDMVRVEKGRMLDFGGFGKGWLIDAYVKIMRAHGVKKFIVNGGGDLYIQSDTPVDIALEDPYDSTRKIGSVKIQKGALAASSTLKRRWENGGETYHHIIDPSTGRSSDSGVVASFILADTTLVADTLATALLIAPELEKTLQNTYNACTKLVYSEMLY